MRGNGRRHVWYSLDETDAELATFCAHLAHALQVPEADVVITNPVRYAVALKYEPLMMGAPVCVAKGQDLIAQRIKDIARDNDVSIVENKPLARELFRRVDIGDEIPDDLFTAVAEVIAFVYKLKKMDVVNV